MKYYGIAKITTKTAVQSKVVAEGMQYKNGMIYVEIPELDLVTPNLVLCRYALSIPYQRIQVGQAVWVEPTVGEKKRWVYTGYADCMENAIDSNYETNIYVDTTHYIIHKTDGEINIKAGAVALEKILLGETTKTELNKLKDDLADLISKFNLHTHATAAVGAPSFLPSVTASSVTASFNSILSAKVKAN